ncbi:hypothetical protein F2Q68_00003889 [Brassica cretica]|uniref:MADS-box domain-containing protein n=2 Tax=Brassica cretica TaxID=69181 RepID=A0A8S9J8L9_BRACR|nr:hypothetical protein F2Q68_00003889 [Brassica cretica]KAF3543818.1 hypothetical protein DY000_02005769 [Brassica cretica]
MVFTTHYDVCFSNYVSDYFRADILHLQSPPFSFVCRSSTTLFCILTPRGLHHSLRRLLQQLRRRLLQGRHLTSSDIRIKLGHKTGRRKNSWRKVEIKRIEDKSSRQVTFCKRRNGLIEKARQLSVLCGSSVAVLIVSSIGKVYSSSSGDR